LKDFKEGAQDVLVALSLANLSFIEMWDGLLNYTPFQAFYLEHAPPRAEYAAAFLNVILVGLVFFALIRFARRIAARFGITGFILGSLPVLLLIALPPSKSIVRLLANRFPDVNLWFVVGTLLFVPLAAAAIARRRFFTVASALLVTISPLILIEGVLSISRCWTDHSAEFADGPLAARAPPASLPRIVWIIFDELDFRLSFLDRPSSVPMQSFDSLRAESIFAENAVSPAPDTIPSVPSLITGKYLASFHATGPSTVLFDDVPASVYPTVFSTVHAMGGNVAVVGWFLPYCRVFSRDLAACSAHDLENQLSETGRTFSESVSLQLQYLFAYRNRSLLGESPRAKHRVEMLSAMHADALRDVLDPSLNLVFLHLPVPHAPYLYDRFSYRFPKRYLGVGTYLDNLALADTYLGDFREAMTNAGLWDKTTVLLTSDHPDRTSLSVDGKEDPRVPFLLKLAGQTSGVTYNPVLQTIVTKPLLEAILARKIKTPEDVINWLSRQ
jgi:Sulfatase